MQGNQNKSDFPGIMSSIHDQPVILARIDPQCTDRFFLCAQDIIEGLNGDKSSLQTYEEFCNCLKKPNPKQQIDDEKEKEIQELIKQKKVNLVKYSKQIEDEKQVVKRLINDKLRELYTKKCNDLTVRLSNELEEQFKIFQDNYEKLIEEEKADHDKNAGLDKYEEMKKKVREMDNPLHIEEYLKNVYKTKLAWGSASENLQNISQRDKQFYKGMIERQLANAPELSDAERMVDGWIQGLDKLVAHVKTDEGVFKNMICPCELKLPLEIDINELELVKNAMIKPDTQLIVKAKENIKEKQIENFKEQLAKLTNLVHFVFDVDQGILPENYIQEFIEPFSQLQKLQSLHIKCFGSKITDKGLAKLSQIFEALPNLKELQLEIGNNEITTEGLNKLSENFHFLKNLQYLNLSLECNKITNRNLNIFCQEFEKLMPQLILLKLNFGGIQGYQNQIESIGANNIIKCLLKADKLKYLTLELGETKLNNVFISELIHTLPKLNQLADLTLILNNNQLDIKSSRKLSKYLSNSRLCKLQLNLSGNDIKVEGANLLIEAITQMELLFQLNLNIRNCEIKRGLATNLKANLEKKAGRQFEEMVFLA